MSLFNPFISFPPVVASGTAWVTSNPGSSLRNDYTGILGGQFTVPSSLTVTHLGVYVVSGSTTPITIYIYSGTGTTLVASATLNPTGLSGWQYVSITPVTLATSTQYFLMRSTVNGGDQWYDGWVPTITSAATGGQDVYTPTAGSAISGGGAPPRQYAGVNFKY